MSRVEAANETDIYLHTDSAMATLLIKKVVLVSRSLSSLLGWSFVLIAIPLLLIALSSAYIVNRLAEESEMIDNLLSNAIKYAPKGSKLIVDLMRNPDTIILRIADQGPGIPMADKQRIFDLFLEGTPPDRPDRSSGVDLAIVREYIEAHHGKVRLLDSETKGRVVFDVEFPNRFKGWGYEPAVARLDWFVVGLDMRSDIRPRNPGRYLTWQSRVLDMALRQSALLLLE